MAAGVGPDSCDLRTATALPLPDHALLMALQRQPNQAISSSWDSLRCCLNNHSY
jgi:hypothetical protein